MGEEGILMCFAFFSDTKVGMHRTSGSFTSQIAMRYRTSRTLHCIIEAGGRVTRWMDLLKPTSHCGYSRREWRNVNQGHLVYHRPDSNDDHAYFGTHASRDCHVTGGQSTKTKVTAGLLEAYLVAIVCRSLNSSFSLHPSIRGGTAYWLTCSS